MKKAHDDWFPTKVLSKGGEVKKDVDGRIIGAAKLKALSNGSSVRLDPSKLPNETLSRWGTIDRVVHTAASTVLPQRI